MTKRARPTNAAKATKEAANAAEVAAAFETLRARLQAAGAAKVLEALDSRSVDEVAAVRGLFVHSSLARGFEDDVAEALARMGDEDALIVGLQSKRPVLRRAAVRALSIVPPTSREVRAALEAVDDVTSRKP